MNAANLLAALSSGATASIDDICGAFSEAGASARLDDAMKDHARSALRAAAKSDDLAAASEALRGDRPLLAILRRIAGV
jgi:hypothetical protein